MLMLILISMLMPVQSAVSGVLLLRPVWSGHVQPPVGWRVAALVCAAVWTLVVQESRRGGGVGGGLDTPYYDEICMWWCRLGGRKASPEPCKVLQLQERIRNTNSSGSAGLLHVSTIVSSSGSRYVQYIVAMS